MSQFCGPQTWHYELDCALPVRSLYPGDRTCLEISWSCLCLPIHYWFSQHTGPWNCPSPIASNHIFPIYCHQQLFPLFPRHGTTTIYNVKLQIFSYPSILTYVLGAQKKRLIETVLLSTHNICFGWEIRKWIVSKSIFPIYCHQPLFPLFPRHGTTTIYKYSKKWAKLTYPRR